LCIQSWAGETNRPGLDLRLVLGVDSDASRWLSWHGMRWVGMSRSILNALLCGQSTQRSLCPPGRLPTLLQKLQRSQSNLRPSPNCESTRVRMFGIQFLLNTRPRLFACPPRPSRSVLVPHFFLLIRDLLTCLQIFLVSTPYPDSRIASVT
jgi:hypothetical protein